MKVQPKYNHDKTPDENLNENYEKLAEGALRRYPDQVNVFESKSMLAKFGRSVGPRDIANLAKQFEQFEAYQRFVEAEEGSLASLGQIPLIGIDVINAIYAQSIAPVVASIQPMNEEQGIVWYKRITAQSDWRRATGVAKGDVLRDRRSLTPDVYNSEYASSTGGNRYMKTVAQGGIDGKADFTLGLIGPLRPQTLNFSFVEDDTGKVIGRLADSGLGFVMSNLGSGTIDPDTYELSFTLSTEGAARVAAVSGNVSVRGFAETDFEVVDQLPLIKPVMDSLLIKAEVQAVETQYGQIQAFMMAKRFGVKASDELAADLTNELTIQQNTRVVEEYVAGPIGTANYPLTAPAGVSLIEHRMGFSSVVAEAEENIIRNAKVGQANVMIAGRSAVTFMRSIPGFKVINAGVTGNVAVMGELDGMPVIRASGIDNLDDDEIVVGYRGAQAIDAPVVVAPVLPLFITDVMGDHQNALKNTKAAASMTGYKSVTPQYTTKITIRADEAPAAEPTPTP